ncbi:MAG: hypothetical protein C4534_06760 [Gaiellales bacterium]|nr:MAG: hypothetical protein C4534_06760 [Gaiellales bacterium]
MILPSPDIIRPDANRWRRRSVAALAIMFSMALALFALSLLTGYARPYSLEKRDEPVTGQLTISPTKTEVILEPGQSASREVTLVNRTGEDVDVTFSIVDFEGSLDPADSHVLVEDGDSAWGASNWLEPELDNIVLEHGETLKLDVRIIVPPGAEPGGHYAALLAESKQEGGEGGVQISYRITSLFLITVPGDIDSRATLNDPETPLIASFGPVNIGLVFNNLGNIHQSPSGVVRVTNVLGQEVAQLPVKEWVVLPESSRRTQVEWPGKWHLGPYKVDAQISYGEDGEVLYASRTIWFIPWEVILAGLAASFVILFIIARITRRRRRMKQEIMDELEELRSLKEPGVDEVQADDYEEEHAELTESAGQDAAADEEAGKHPSISGDLVPLNQLLPSTDDINLVDISDPETRHLIRELINNEMDLARMYIIEGKNEEARRELMEARSAAMRIKLFTEVAVIDDLLNYL